MGKLLSSFSIPVNWKKVSKYLQNLSGSSELAEIVDQRIEIVLREQHPDDYDEYVLENKEKINEIRERMIQKYSLDLKRKGDLVAQIEY